MTPNDPIDGIYQKLLDREEAVLSEWGFRSRDSSGRAIPEKPCPVRLPFQRDRDRILHSKAFRRLKHKTQVFLAPEDDHYRTRLTHTLEVNQIARTIGRALGLNEDLIEAISLGHDLGHTPFGHAGEKILDGWCLENGMPEGFHHHLQSVRVVEKLENEGGGLNLTREVIEGILKHTKGRSDYLLSIDSDEEMHWEGRIVKIADRIAYVNHDLQDAISAGILSEDVIPGKFNDVLGSVGRKRIASMVKDIVGSTLKAGTLSLTPVMQETINGLKEFLFDRLYEHPKVRAHDAAIKRCLEILMDTFMSERAVYIRYIHDWPDDETERKQKLIDYVAGMTDPYAVRIAEELLIPGPWPI